MIEFWMQSGDTVERNGASAASVILQMTERTLGKQLDWGWGVGDILLGVYKGEKKGSQVEDG